MEWWSQASALPLIGTTETAFLSAERKYGMNMGGGGGGGKAL